MEKEYPSSVTDKLAYDEYIELSKSEIFKDPVFRDARLPEPIDLTTSAPALQKKVASLRDKSLAEEILQAGKEVRSMTAKLREAKARAYRVVPKTINIVGRDTSVLAAKHEELIELFASGKSAQEVHCIVVTKWAYDLPISYVTEFRKKYFDKIKTRQIEMLSDLSDVSFAHKKNRLVELSALYAHRKLVYQRTESREDYKVLLATIKQIAQEIEGDKLVIEGNINIVAQINQHIHTHVQKEMYDKMNLLDVIIARVAARCNVNPMYLLFRLHTSIYSKYSGFGEQTHSPNDVPINYPSSIVYDFDKLRQVADEVHKQDKNLALMPILNKPQAQQADVSLRQQLKQRVRRRQEDINDVSDIIENG